MAMNIVAPPCSWKRRQKRIRWLLGLPSGHPLPRRSRRTCRRFLARLKTCVCFPCEADYLPQLAPHLVHVELLGFAAGQPAALPQGILCEAHDGRRTLRIPLARVSVPHADTNFPYIDDYAYWFWNAPRGG